mgnify:CR=1 FL=1
MGPPCWSRGIPRVFIPEDFHPPESGVNIMKDWSEFEKIQRKKFPEYGVAVFELFWPAGDITVLSREGLLSGPLPDSDLIFITGYNPGRLRPTDLQNQKANQYLQSALQKADLSFYRALGRNQERTHEEPSFAVALETGPQKFQLAYISSLAGSLGQAALFYWDGNARKGRTLWLVTDEES